MTLYMVLSLEIPEIFWKVRNIGVMTLWSLVWKSPDATASYFSRWSAFSMLRIRAASSLVEPWPSLAAPSRGVGITYGLVELSAEILSQLRSVLA